MATVFANCRGVAHKGVDDGPHEENIGYNINSANNGFWLPGNYAVRPWKGLDPDFQQAYAFLAMHDTERQFHDSGWPPLYKDFVRKHGSNASTELQQLRNDKTLG